MSKNVVLVHPPGEGLELIARITDGLLQANAGDKSVLKTVKEDLEQFYWLCENGGTSGYIEGEGPRSGIKGGRA